LLFFVSAAATVAGCWQLPAAIAAPLAATAATLLLAVKSVDGAQVIDFLIFQGQFSSLWSLHGGVFHWQ